MILNTKKHNKLGISSDTQKHFAYQNLYPTKALIKIRAIYLINLFNRIMFRIQPTCFHDFFLKFICLLIRTKSVITNWFTINTNNICHFLLLFYFLLLSALPAILFVLAEERLTLKAFDTAFATLLDVPIFISPL